jgi:hemerythrin superfamily protein
MDAALLEELEMQHRQVEELFEKLSSADDEKQQRTLVEQLVQMLDQHMQLEETEVYPEVSSVDQELEEEAEIEHDLGREGIAKLQAMIGMPGFGAAVAMLEAGIAHHVEEEEGEVFPKLREALGMPAADVSKKDLYEQARAAGIEGRSSMSKEELAAALESSG